MIKTWEKQQRIIKIALLLFSAIFIGNKVLFAQDKLPIKFGSVSLTDFDLPKSNAIDSNSNAVIVADIGSTEFVGNKHNWYSYVFKKNIRIKILNKKAYDLATVKIRMYEEEDWIDKIEDFHASTYNVEDGKVVETRLNEKEIFTEKIRKYVNEKKFTMPNVKEGSILEYSYTITSFFYNDLPSWSFQNLNYPCLYSSFKISIPQMLQYLILRQGVDSFYSSKSEQAYKNILMNDVNVSSVMYNRKWIMKDVPAFKNETYINYATDYLNKLEFVLAQTNNGRDVRSIATDWRAAEDKLLNIKRFGTSIKVEYAGNLYNTMKNNCLVDGDALDAAKSIYSYIKNNFTCIPNDDIYIDDLYEVNKLRKGNVSELNMLLIALLRQRGINVDPVILSTKEFGSHPITYPVLQKMNYVIAMMRIGNDTLYLDASKPLLGFGKLPLSCYNGHAEIIDEKHSGSLFFNCSAIKEQNITSVIIVNDENGNGSSGSFQSALGYFGSYDVRNIIKVSGEKEYLKNIQLNYGSDIEITNLQIDSLKQLENPIKINYDFNYKQANVDDIIYFNPVISGNYKENPFKAAERKYPIEMPYPIDDLYVLNMEIPKGYKVDELPKSIKIAFNGIDGYFEYNIQKEENLVQLRSHIKLRQAVFAAENYNNLRSFFAYIVKKQSEQIVFKKI